MDTVKVAGPQVTISELLTGIERASILDAIGDLSEAPTRIHTAATGFIKMQHDYAAREAEITVNTLANPDLKNDMQRKAAVDFEITHDDKLTQWNSGLIISKSAMERERNRLEAAKMIIRALELLLK